MGTSGARRSPTLHGAEFDHPGASAMLFWMLRRSRSISSSTLATALRTHSNPPLRPRPPARAAVGLRSRRPVFQRQDITQQQVRTLR
jgi:hypothetical protein